MKREHKVTFDFEVENAIGFGIVIGNLQPKKNYATARWELAFFFLCFSITVDWSYRYKK